MAVRRVIFVAAASALVASEVAPKQTAVDEFAEAALPDLDFFMQESQDLSKDFAEKAELMKTQVATSEKEKTKALSQMKRSFERNLTALAWQSDQLVNDTNALTSLIDTEVKHIARLRDESNRVQKSNDIMRRALDGLQSKIRASANFLSETLQVTDDSNVIGFDVLQTTTPEPTVENFLETLGKSRVSFLGVSHQTVRKTRMLQHKKEPQPEVLVETLANRLDDLAAAGEQGEAELQARFMAFYELGAAKQAELFAQKESLQQDLESKKALHTQLVAVKKHLLQIKAQLIERVQGVRFFAVKSNEFATNSLVKAAAMFNESTH